MNSSARSTLRRFPLIEEFEHEVVASATLKQPEEVLTQLGAASTIG